MYYLANKDKLKAQMKVWYLTNKEKVLAGKRAYRLVDINKERTKAYHGIYNFVNRKRLNARQKTYYNSDRGRFFTKNNNHKRRQLEFKGSGITNQQWNELLREYNFRCAYCGIQTNMTIDHVIPLSKGGEHSIENIVPSCAECNSHKHTKLNWIPKKFKEVVGV